jgi:hypothetical protein
MKVLQRYKLMKSLMTAGSTSKKISSDVSDLITDERY